MEERRKELDHLRGASKCNGYQEWILRDLKKKITVKSEKVVETSEETMETWVKDRSKKIPVMIPYLKGFLEQMGRVLGKYGIPTYFKPANTLWQLLVKLKDPVSKENVVGPVCKIKCEECDAVYVSETERSLKQGLVNIGDLARWPQRFQNTSTLITPNILWSCKTLKY